MMNDWEAWYCPHSNLPHFVDEKAEAQRRINLLQIRVSLISCKAYDLFSMTPGFIFASRNLQRPSLHARLDLDKHLIFLFPIPTEGGGNTYCISFLGLL